MSGAQTPRPTYVLGDFDLGWLAGWLEGEGHFYAKIYSGNLKIGVQAQSTDQDVIERAHSLVPGSNTQGPYVPENPRWSPSYQWGVYSRVGAVYLATILRPLMGIRRQEQIDVLIATEATVSHRKVGRCCGTYSGYMGGCRCEFCRAANTEYMRNLRAKNEGRIISPRKLGRQCGTYSAYTKGCRCSLCKAANAAYSRSYYNKKKVA